MFDRRVLTVAVAGSLLLCCRQESPGEAQSTAATATDTAAATIPSADLEPHDMVKGQTVYVPVYSHIYFKNKERKIQLAVTLSVRNTDEAHPITVTAMRYFGTEGQLLRRYGDMPLRVGPMATFSVVIEPGADAGGSGANFIVEWVAAEAVTEPVIEAVMISAQSQQGISFISTGRIIKEQS